MIIFELKLEETFTRCEKYPSELDISVDSSCRESRLIEVVIAGVCKGTDGVDRLKVLIHSIMVHIHDFSRIEELGFKSGTYAYRSGIVFREI